MRRVPSAVRRTAVLASAVLLAGCAAVGSTGAASSSPQASDPSAATATPAATSSPTGTEGTGAADDASSPPTAAAAAGSAPAVALETVAEGLTAPVHAFALDGRTLVVQQDGLVVELADDGGTSPWLDLRDRVEFGGERGLLGMAVLPGDTHVVAHYSAAGTGATTLATLPLVDGRPDAEDVTVVLERPQPARNHNGGSVVVTPDGLVLLGLGDGGGAGDTYGNGQDPSTLLGTVLRLDLADPSRVAVPPDNPYADGGDGDPLVWLHGLRNPYRIAIGDGQLYVADVGQDAVEEVTVVPLDSTARNLGWPVLEGDRCFASGDCDTAGLEPPDVTYTHAETDGCSVIGGLVYAGEALPALDGHLLYGDLCGGFLRTVRAEDGVPVAAHDLTDQVRADGLLSVAADADGEPLLLLGDGSVRRLVPVT